VTGGGELQRWLSQPQRQRRTQQGIRGLAGEWRASPERVRFERTIAALPDPSAESVAQAVHSLFADHDWVDALVETMAARVRDDPFFEPPFGYLSSELQSGLVLIETPLVFIALSVTHAARLAARKTARRGATSIGFPGRMIVLKFIRAGGARISLWEADPITADFTAADAGTCRRTGERRLHDGEVLTLDGRCQSYVIEQARSNLLVLQAEISAGEGPLSVEYDSATHEFVGCSAADDGASRVQMIATLLRKLGRDDAFEPIAAFLDHKDFFVRWHMMKELLGIDADAALPHLKRMAARDPHPDTRRAARTVLERLETPQPRRQAA
jgi:hypothetical protein